MTYTAKDFILNPASASAEELAALNDALSYLEGSQVGWAKAGGRAHAERIGGQRCAFAHTWTPTICQAFFQ